MFGKGYRLPFNLMGIPVYLDVTFLIVLPLFAWVIANVIRQEIPVFGMRFDFEGLQEGVVPYVLGLIAAIGLFVSVVLHELGHSVTAQQYGVRVRNITLWLLGGVAQFEEMPRQRGAEAVVAIVGPIVSVVLGGIFLLIYALIPMGEGPAVAAMRFLAGYLGLMNIVLAVFNMLPALPLDGGRVLRSLLALKMPHLRATQMSAVISKFLAILLGVFGLLIINPILILLAIFIYMAVNAETQQSLIVEMLEGIGVRDLMTREVATVEPQLPVAELTQKMIREHHLGFPVLNEHGELIGLVSLGHIQGADPNAPVGQVMSREVNTIAESAGALDAFQQMSRNNFGRLVVVDDFNQMSGIITKTDLMRAIQIRLAAMDQSGTWQADERMEPALDEPR